MANVSFYRKTLSTFDEDVTVEGAITFVDTGGVYVGTGSSATRIATDTSVLQNTGSLSIMVNGTTYLIYKVINTVSEATDPDVLYIFEA